MLHYRFGEILECRPAYDVVEFSVLEWHLRCIAALELHAHLRGVGVFLRNLHECLADIEPGHSVIAEFGKFDRQVARARRYFEHAASGRDLTGYATGEDLELRKRPSGLLCVPAGHPAFHAYAFVRFRYCFHAAIIALGPRVLPEQIGERAIDTGELRELSPGKALTHHEMILDHWVASLLAPLAFWVLINGVDDLVVDIAGVVSYIQRKFSADPAHRDPTEEELDAAPPRLMAIFVALWKEHRVIQKMIENNVTKLRYEAFRILRRSLPQRRADHRRDLGGDETFPNVHLSVCPHDGPTSKADCLNWIYQRMLVFEEERGVRFDMILTHDAEDLMDPDALRWINYYAQWNQMVQIPVLALPTPIFGLAHGVYCDEFAEYQFKDMPARQLLGGFIPSNGVGTGFSREALEGLARAHSNRIFEPACLTEDYENGWRIHHMGMRQKFIPVQIRHGRAIATREYFPLTFRTAIRQRSRWVTGIGLQSWEFHSTRDTFSQLYWFWRDRKSVIGNFVSPLTNVLFVVGAATWIRAATSHPSVDAGA